MELNEQEAHCIARLLQSALFGKSIFDGCFYCKHQCGNKLPMFQAIRDRLTEETAVDIDPIYYGEIPNSDFPYLKFLKNSNEHATAYFRERFSGT